MDYKELSTAVKMCGSTPKVDQCRKCQYWDEGDMSKCIPKMTEDAATAITDLLARAEAAEKERDEEKRHRIHAEQHADAFMGDCESLYEKLNAAEVRAEKAESERDAAISDLTYIARTYPVDLCDDLVCQYCKHYQNVNTGCPGWTENDCFEWRGKKEE